MSLTPYLRREPSSSAPLRLFCTAHAGGGASVFARWAQELPDWVNVCPLHLPGRENRFKEPAPTNLRSFSEELADALAPYTGQPYALFGYSLGSLVQFELARRLRERNLPDPARLIVCAAWAPQLPRTLPPLFHLPDQLFLRELDARYGGLGPEVLAHRELIEICLPSLRGDFSMLETYEYESAPQLTMPITVFAGSEDQATPLKDVQPWKEQTTADCSWHEFSGGHFFINSHREEFFAKLIAELEKTRTGS